jgi:hypothetical protein
MAPDQHRRHRTPAIGKKRHGLYCSGWALRRPTSIGTYRTWVSTIDNVARLPGLSGVGNRRGGWERERLVASEAHRRSSGSCGHRCCSGSCSRPADEGRILRTFDNAAICTAPCCRSDGSDPKPQEQARVDHSIPASGVGAVRHSCRRHLLRGSVSDLPKPRGCRSLGPFLGRTGCRCDRHEERAAQR